MYVNLKITETTAENISYPKITDKSFFETLEAHRGGFIGFLIAAFLVCPLDLGFFCSGVAVILSIIWLCQTGYQKILNLKLKKAYIEYTKDLIETITQYRGYKNEDDYNVKIKIFLDCVKDSSKIANLKIFLNEKGDEWLLIKPNQKIYGTMRDIIEGFKAYKDKCVETLQNSCHYTVELEIWLAFLGVISFIDLLF